VEALRQIFAEARRVLAGIDACYGGADTDTALACEYQATSPDHWTPDAAGRRVDAGLLEDQPYGAGAIV